MRATLLHNPGAGVNQPTREELTRAIEQKGYEVHYQSTKQKPIDWNHLRERTDLFVVAGGDGTVGKISRKLVGCHVPIGILPIGTANNIATSLGIKEDYQYLINHWNFPVRTRFSVGEASGIWGKTHFIESIGFGLFTKLMKEVYGEDIKRQKDEPEEEIRQAVEHLLKLVHECEPEYYEIKVDGKDVSGEYIMVEVMNIKCIGPNLMLAPVATHHDDELELVLIGEKEKDDLIEYFSNKLENKHIILNVPYFRGKHIEIKAATEAHIDDEVRHESKNTTFKICLSKEYLEFLSV